MCTHILPLRSIIDHYYEYANTEEHVTIMKYNIIREE